MMYEYRDINMNYEIIGDGKPVLLLHGFGCSLELMKYCMEPVFGMEEGYQRIYVDLPGMGQSGACPEFAAADKILEVLIAFIQDRIPGKFLLVGESYGGYLARGILARQKENVDGLLLLCPVIIPDRDKRTLPDKTVIFEDKVYLEGLETEERSSFLEYAVIANEKTYKRYQKEVQSGMKQADAAFLERLNQHYAFGFDVIKIIKEMCYTKPALFICGRQDNCVGYRDLWELIEDYPRAAFLIIDAAGHNLQIEQPEMFEASVHNWLRRVETY